MVRSSLRTALTLSALGWLALPVLADDKEQTAAELGKPWAGAAAEKAARDILDRFDKGDPGWQVRMEAWVGLMKAGPAAVPPLEDAVKKESSAVRALAMQTLTVLRGPAEVPRAVTAYDLSALDSARLGQAAPDFSLTDVSGRAYRLSQFRGKKTVVLTFFPDDG